MSKIVKKASNSFQKPRGQAWSWLHFMCIVCLMCRCGAQSKRQEEFTNLSLDLVPGSSVEELLQEYLMVRSTCPRSVTSSLTQVVYVCVCVCVFSQFVTQFITHSLLSLICRSQSWSTNVSAEGTHRARGRPSRPCQGESHHIT